MPCVHSRWSSWPVVWPAVRACSLGDLRAEDDVAEQPRLGLLVVVAGAQLVHREGHDVGRALLVHPLHVVGGHRRRVHGDDRQLGERVDPEPVEHEARQRGQPVGVDVGAGLVVDVDGHRGAHRPAALLAAAAAAAMRSPGWLASHRP